MSVLNENQLLGASGAGGEYEIEQSLRFNGTDERLTRTFPSAGNRKVWTWSGWVKRSNMGANQYIFNAGPFNSGNDFEGIRFVNDDTLRGILTISNSTIANFSTNAKFRDPSAWYHIVWQRNGQSYKIYVNGTEQTYSATTFSSNPDGYISSNTEHQIGARLDEANDYDGYIGEVNFIDGQALTPDSFGETGDYGEWKPTEYAGTYGTNGFYLPFEQDYTVEGFSTVTYEGTSASQYIGGTGFSPDLSWFKVRSTTGNSQLYDTVRGASSRLVSNATTAEATTNNGFAGWQADGFGLDSGGGGGDVNTNGRQYVAWNWDMGGTTASNTSGTINSSVRANQAYGQSIVSYSGTGSNATVGHGLASAPDMVICRPRNLATHWRVWHEGLTNGTYTLFLNSTGAQQVQSDAFGSLPTSSVFSVAADLNTNTQPYIAYCFHSVTNYSSFGSYSGNGSTTGPVVTTGFSPAFVMIKRTDAVDNWIIMDNTRDPYNPADKWLYPSGNFEEYDGATRELDFLANGFQPKAATTEFNASGSTYIYAAFADTREYAYWYDQSGNNNDWTSEGGLTESDVMLDSPTNNFCTLNPLDEGGSNTVSEGNLQYIKSGSNFGPMRGTLGVTTGKWYFEAMRNSDTDICQVGVSNNYDISQNGGDNTMASTGGIGAAWDSRGYYYRTGGSDSGKNTFATNEIVSVAFDADTGKIWWRKSGGSWQDSGNPETGANPSFTASGYSELMPFVNGEAGGGLVANFGADSSFAGTKTPQSNSDANDIGDFFYPVPSGFKALCSANLEAPTVVPSEHFNTVLYTGTGTTQSVAGVGFQPDFTWLKSRSAAGSNNVFDVVRGAPYRLYTNGTGAEDSPNQLTSFDSDGFTLASGNNNGATYVGWNWKAGGSASSNSNGTITSQVSANVDAGFSVVSYTGNGSAGATIGHGLGGVIPELVINKRRTSASEWWIVYHSSVCTGDDNWLALNTTGALRSGGESMYDVSGFTSTTFGVNAGSGVNVSGATQIAYCFHSVESYSKVGSYVGNGNANGPMVNCGFFPNFVMIKRTDSGSHWEIHDIAREPNNVKTKLLNADQSNAEDNNANSSVDFISNGFKLRTSHAERNASGGTYIYAAFAESPFKNSNAR